MKPSPKTPTTSPKKASLRSAAKTQAVDLESSKTRGGKQYSSLQSKSAPSTTHHANVDLKDALESVEPAPSVTRNEFYSEEVIGKLETQIGFLTARNRTLAEENVDLKRQLQKSDKKVNELSPLEERNQHLQNEVAALRKSE
jgi:hypothetical protein